MAFIRKKGKSYYLVHNVREDGHVRQVHLACLGNRPRVSDEVLEQVQRAHPHLQVDWEAVRSRAAETFTSPFSDREGVEILLRSMRTLQQDLAELNFDKLSARLREAPGGGDAPEAPAADHVVAELMGQMQKLHDQLETKLKHQPTAHAYPPASDLRPESDRADTGD